MAYSANDNEIRRYTEFKKDFDKLNTEDVKKLFSKLDYEKEKRALLLQVYENTTSLFNDLSSTEREWLQTNIEEILENSTTELRDWWVTDESLKLKIVDIESNIKQQLQGASEKAREFAELVKAHGQLIKEKMDELNISLQKQFEGDTSLQKVADLRANAEDRLKRVAKLRKSYLEKWNNLTEILKSRSELTVELSSIQNEIAGVRAMHNERLEKTLNSFLPDWMNVSILLKPGGDSEEFAKWLYQVFGARSNQAKKIRQFIEDNISPVGYAEMILNQNFDKLIEIYEKSAGDKAISNADLDKNIECTKVFEKDEAADVDVFVDNGKRLSMLLDLQETKWDDKEAILLNDVPVNEKSPGQRSSAMLPLIALAEKTPLIIDQPEDNLDKRLVGTVLSGVLAELKEHRQIIVCTHDPNILVGGDAEQIVVLDAKSDKKGVVQEHGSIDNNDIIKTVVDLLEGGDEAFALREKRYRGRV
ncbi:MAG: AAA family ATPase [Candidatus Thiodiazotropha endolucinida]